MAGTRYSHLIELRPHSVLVTSSMDRVVTLVVVAVFLFPVG